MIARLHRRFRENPIMFTRVPRDHWLALHSLAAARQVTPNDIIRGALAGVIATADMASLPSPGSYQSPRPIRSWISSRVWRLWISRWGRRLRWTMRMRANEGVCSVEIANGVGFFGQMYWCLCIFQYCERHRLIPDIRLTDKIYLDCQRGPNWLHYYFDRANPITSEEIARRVRYTKKITAIQDMGLPAGPRMSLDDGARLLYKYLRLKPHITTMVDDFWKTFSLSGPVVGVHYRGTDKTSEAPRVSWDHCLNVLENYLRNDPTIQAVFVASDEQAFIDFIKKSMVNVLVFSHDDHYRSLDGRPVHTATDGGGYEKGEDALVNALLLSKCSTLIRTTSMLSACASLFNPDLKVILLNKPYDNRLVYPENEILKKTDTEYLPEGIRRSRQQELNSNLHHRRHSVGSIDRPASM
jgi:hypothetical protein